VGKDSKIDPDNLHTESLNIPVLHSKYFELYNTIFLLRKKAEQQKEIFDTNAMNIILENQIQKFM
jgi:hypothetical protein